MLCVLGEFCVPSSLVRRRGSLEFLLSVHRTINEIDVGQWNCLAGDNAFATHGWLKTIEATCRVPLQALYFTLADDGKLVAAAVCYVCPPTVEIETLDDLIFGRLSSFARAAGLTFLPALVCGPLLGYGWHIGIRHDLSDEGAAGARHAILAAMASEADARSLPLSFVHVLDAERELKALLADQGFLCCRNIPVAVLDIEWRSFDEYMATRPSKRRRDFQRQIKRYRDAGNSLIQLEHITAAEPRLLTLLDWNGLKHNGRRFPCGPGFFTTLTSALGDRVRIVASERSGVITAVSVMLVHDRTAFPIAVGVDDQAGNDYSYFYVTYNALIGSAIETGVRRMYYGRGLYDVKVRRGCWLTNTWIYVRSQRSARLPSRAWFAVTSVWNHQKLSSEARQSLIS